MPSHLSTNLSASICLLYIAYVYLCVIYIYIYVSLSLFRYLLNLHSLSTTFCPSHRSTVSEAKNSGASVSWTSANWVHQWTHWANDGQWTSAVASFFWCSCWLWVVSVTMLLLLFMRSAIGMICWVFSMPTSWEEPCPHPSAERWLPIVRSIALNCNTHCTYLYRYMSVSSRSLYVWIVRPCVLKTGVYHWIIIVDVRMPPKQFRS